MGTRKSPLTFTADVEIAQKLRVVIKSGTVTEPPEVEIAGIGEVGVGINDFIVKAGEDCAVNIFGNGGTVEMVADGVIAEGQEVYPAAGGKCSATPSGSSLGVAMEAATADGDIIEVLPHAGAVSAQVLGDEIATTGNSDAYITAPKSGILSSAVFAGTDALAADDTNYLEFGIFNFGQDGGGPTTMLDSGDVNTTKATGGSAIVANERRDLTLTSTAADLIVQEGDRLLIRAGSSATLANTVGFPTYLLNIA